MAQQNHLKSFKCNNAHILTYANLGRIPRGGVQAWVFKKYSWGVILMCSQCFKKTWETGIHVSLYPWWERDLKSPSSFQDTQISVRFPFHYREAEGWRKGIVGLNYLVVNFIVKELHKYKPVVWKNFSCELLQIVTFTSYKDYYQEDLWRVNLFTLHLRCTQCLSLLPK